MSAPARPTNDVSKVVDGLLAGQATSGAAVERRQPADLAEILERVLNTGIVIAGEIRIDLLDIELLTIKLRLIVTSIDRAEEIGLDWWRGDSWYSAAERDDPSVSELVRETQGSDASPESESASRSADADDTTPRSSTSGDSPAPGAAAVASTTKRRRRGTS